MAAAAHNRRRRAAAGGQLKWLCLHMLNQGQLHNFMQPCGQGKMMAAAPRCVAAVLRARCVWPRAAGRRCVLRKQARTRQNGGAENATT